ncbi:MAG: tryptophan synthase subunit alpha [Pleurocapsa minor GSE-CHR-MK-17-07R]|jgi:tryptophan synthase alpha chain|nr:tryptophan synthase subunit alpha [Pleurocapsa minor GSE-CHR-MK 17-07R]
MGTNPLLETLRDIRASGRMALCGYFLAGYPMPEQFFHVARASRELDVIEFGIPTPTPVMDGPVIARAHEVVIHERGLGAETALALIGGLRDLRQPRFVMTYADVGRGLDGFLRLCLTNDIHGMLAPDLRLDETTFVVTIAHALNLCLFSLLDARADDAALAHAVDHSDIVYLKASVGPTGTAADLSRAGELYATLESAIMRIRQRRPGMPVAVGIGLQTPEQVAALAALDVDMAIVGTRIIEHVQQGEAALTAYIREMRAATLL